MGEWERAVFGRPLILFVLFCRDVQRVPACQVFILS